MPKMKLNVDELSVSTFGTEPVGSEAPQGMDVGAYTLGDHTCRTCRLSVCQETSCC